MITIRMRNRGFAVDRGQHRGAAGFSLVEVVLVMVIIGVLLGLTLPTLLNRIGDAQLSSSADQLTGMLRFARLEAMQRGEPVRVRWDKESRYFIAEARKLSQNRTEGGGQTGGGDGFEPITPAWALQQILPEGVDIAAVIVSPPSVIKIQRDLEDQESSSAGLTQSRINTTFSLNSDADEEELEKPDDDQFVPVTFEPDGSTLEQFSLRVVLVPHDEAKEDTLATDEDVELDTAVSQRWITVNGLTGKVSLHTPTIAEIELANDYLGQEDKRE